jgi:hypothetical protein
VNSINRAYLVSFLILVPIALIAGAGPVDALTGALLGALGLVFAGACLAGVADVVLHARTRRAELNTQANALDLEAGELYREAALLEADNAAALAWRER